ncbi:MAG TPA: exodeoxyribonuclease V subunit alpha [Chitinophagaceae bacterium]|jgi:exodeoxyribonuclease V alpha subunit
MQTLNDVHQQFAEYFDVPELKPYVYLLSKKLSEGHICLHLDKIREQPDSLPAFCNNMAEGSAALKGLPLLATGGDEQQPFVLDGNRLYLQRYFRYETRFLQRLYQFLETETALVEERTALLQKLKELVAQLFDSPGAQPRPDWQLAAVITGVLNNFTIITGGPGTGKTTTVAKILAILYAANPTVKVALAAPTGKAAARMAESLRTTTIPVDAAIIDQFQALSPSTIHRLLKPKTGTPYFRHDRENPLSYDVVIVDECSMIDVALFAKLFDAIGPATRLILLGDKDQLASVEAGSLFGDLCQAQEELNFFSAERLAFINSFIKEAGRQIPPAQAKEADRHPLFQHLVELRHSHRFTGDKGIGKFSRAVIGNDTVVLQEFLQPGADEQVVMDMVYSETLFEQFITGYEAFVAEKNIRRALKKMNALRVLCAVREGEQGLYATNRKIEKYLHDKKIIRVNAGFYENRPVILTRNYYEHGLFNGDTGIIRPDKNGQLMAWFEDSTGELKSVLPGYLTQVETVFAMTIHKSQGSEFDEVLVVLPRQVETALLTRELLYTAVTRARNRVYVQATAIVVLTAAQRFVERASGITDRLPANR